MQVLRETPLRHEQKKQMGGDVKKEVMRLSLGSVEATSSYLGGYIPSWNSDAG